MLKRMRRMWELSNKDPEALKALESLPATVIKSIPERANGKAEFLGEGTEDEYLDLERKDKGLKDWYDRLKQL